MKPLLIFLFLLIFGVSKAQKTTVINQQSTSFQLIGKKDTIDFIVYDTILQEKKPIFLWCQGSLPYPIYIRSNKAMYLIGGGITNFDISHITKHYHLVVISMPQTPLIVEENQVNDAYWYYGNSKDKNIPTESFQRADYLDNYTNRAIKVLNFLKKQKWVNPSKLIVAGHSQGSKIATKIAKNFSDVTHLGLFGANPFGRIDQLVRRIRKDAENKVITWEEAEQQIEQQYELYREANNPESTSPDLIAWKTFSEPIIDDWLQLKQPIYLAYGTNDITSELCDLVPFYFIREHKKNLTYKRYFNVEHNFFEIEENGKVNHDKPHWKEVMSTFVDWTLKK